MPAFPLHGNSFKNGVKFSVHTTSRGNVPCNRCKFDNVVLAWPTAGWKDMTGLVVLVESIKFSEAQKRPESAFVRVNHLPSALQSISPIPLYTQEKNILLIRLGLDPSPKLHARSSLLTTTPRSRAPTLRIPSSQAKPQMQLPRISMLQNLPQAPRKISKVLLLERFPARIALEIEGGEEERGMKGS
jgi:hypothetical protein